MKGLTYNLIVTTLWTCRVVDLKVSIAWILLTKNIDNIVGLLSCWTILQKNSDKFACQGYLVNLVECMGACWLHVHQTNLLKGFHIDDNYSVYEINLLMDSDACDP